MRSALCLLASIAFMHLLAGCVGGVAVKPLECQSPYPLEDYVYTKDSFGPTKYFPDISPASNPRNKEDFRREFGEPDEIAAGALFSARLANVAIPEQLSIVGFENSPFSRQTWPPLTTANVVIADGWFAIASQPVR